MTVVIGHELGESFCKALGISSDDVTGIKIVLEVESAVEVTITRFINKHEGAEIEKVLEKYQLHSIGN